MEYGTFVESRITEDPAEDDKDRKNELVKQDADEEEERTKNRLEMKTNRIAF